MNEVLPPGHPDAGRSSPPTGQSAFPAGPVSGAVSGSVSGSVGGRGIGDWPLPTDAPPSAYLPGALGLGRPGQGTHRRALLWYGGVAAVVVVVGLIVVLVLTATGNLGSGHGLLSGGAGAPRDARPPLAKLCPAPTVSADTTTASVPPATGDRTVDSTAGISYRAFGDPWRSWPFHWHMGTLEVPYGVGQYFVTETFAGGDYYASILSAAVPATVNDSVAIDIECTGRQVAADVRAEYYPQPNTMELMRDERATLGGRPAWVTKFRLHFTEPGLAAKDELVGVAVIDVGRPTAAVLYVSIPGTHREWDHAVDEVLASVRLN